MEKQLVCINCPAGCRLGVLIEGGIVVSVAGHSCKIGSAYARQEAIAPLRILTCNMKAQGKSQPFSVRTDRPIPKDMLLACAMEIRHFHPSPPIALGDTVIENLLGTGSNVIATQDLI